MPSTTEDLYSTSAMYGASTGRPRRRKNDFIRLHGSAKYGKWYLGINDEKPATQKTPG
jgi:hypothetical protein